MKMKKIKRDAATRQQKPQANGKATGKFAGRTRFAVFVVFLSTLLSFACTPRSFEKPNVAVAPTPSTAEEKQASFQNELEKMKIADLQYIFVFRRKDGGAMDGEDKKYLKTNLPFNNRAVLADEDKAVVVGSNYKFPPENLEVLRLHFNVEDFSSAPETAK